MASNTGTFTAVQQVSRDLALQPGETANIVLTRTGSGAFSVKVEERVAGLTYGPVTSYAANQSAARINNDSGAVRYLRLNCSAIAGGDSIAYTLEDLTGEAQVRWFDGSGTQVAAITDIGFAGDLVGDVTGDVTGNVTGDVTGNLTGDVTGNVGATLAAPGAGIGASRVDTSITQEGDLIVTRIFVELTGLASAAAADVLGLAAGGAAYIGRITSASGTIVGGTLRCFEAPAGGDADIDVYSATAATAAYDDAISGIAGQTQAVNSGTLALTTDGSLIPDTIEANDYLYLVSVGATADTYTAGRILLTLYGI